MRRVVEGFAQLPDCAVQPDLEIHERVGRPERAAEVIAAHDLAGLTEQQLQDLERLLGETDL